jgi:hypothetical protein
LSRHPLFLAPRQLTPPAGQRIVELFEFLEALLVGLLRHQVFDKPRLLLDLRLDDDGVHPFHVFPHLDVGNHHFPGFSLGAAQLPGLVVGFADAQALELVLHRPGRRDPDGDRFHGLGKVSRAELPERRFDQDVLLRQLRKRCLDIVLGHQVDRLQGHGGRRGQLVATKGGRAQVDGDDDLAARPAGHVHGQIADHPPST